LERAAFAEATAGQGMENGEWQDSRLATILEEEELRVAGREVKANGAVAAD
jgi:hypothetical protein